MKYRILEENGIFYPQEKKSIFHCWRYIQRSYSGINWSSSYGKYESFCFSFMEAEQRINKRKEYISKKGSKTIIHKV